MKNIAVIVDNRPSPQLQKIIEAHMKHLPGWHLHHLSNVPISSQVDYNEILCSIEFWSRYVDYDRVLIFQHDSMLLRDGIEEFLEWDYVGAPWFEGAAWARQDRAGGNGGLSIRNPRAHIEVLEREKYHPSKNNEDVFFVHRLDNVAPFEVCNTFSCETVYQLGTLGYHAIDKYLTEDEQDRIINQYG